MYKIAAGLTTLLLSASLQAAPAPDVAAVLEYSSHRVSNDGETRDVRYQERFFRVDNHLWTQRIVPAHAVAKHEGGEHSLEVTLAARHVQLDRKMVRLSLVDMSSQTVVETSERDYPQLGFDGRWDNAYYLFDPAQLKAMSMLAHKDAPVGTAWYEQRKQGRFLRVLWSEPQQLPLRQESGRDDGSVLDVLTVTPVDLAKAGKLPWQGLAGFRHKDFIDFLD